MPLQKPFQRVDSCGSARLPYAQENDAAMRQTFGKHFVTEILVRRDKDAIVSNRRFQYAFIVRARIEFGNGKDIVALAAQPASDPAARAFIHNNAHLYPLNRNRNHVRYIHIPRRIK